MHFCSIAIIALQLCNLASAQHFEEFVVRGPHELHSAAINAYISEKNKYPEVKDMGDDSPIMKRAKEYAVKRFLAPRDEDLVVRKSSLGVSNEGLLQLPSPDSGQQSFLTAAVTSRSASSGELMTQGDVNALAVSLNEDIGLGAISRAGALPLGEDMGWVKFVEDKLKRDAQIDHQSLLWELGSQVTEDAQMNSGGMNVSLEMELYRNLTEWFTKQGGVLKYLEPSITKEDGLKLIATEEIHAYDTIISVPLKLTMCRISARNVLIPKKGKYLGEELKKTFEKNEVWALAIFLLHEWYKEFAGSGSKWGPYLRTLRMRSLTTNTMQALAHTRAIELTKQWFKSSSDLRFFSNGIDGPCSPTSNICNTKPNDKFNNNRFEMHHMRWAYWVVKQNAVRVYHSSTGSSFLALIPFFDMLTKKSNPSARNNIVFDMSGSIVVSTDSAYEEGEFVGVHPGNFTDTEFFLRYLTVPKNRNVFNSLPLQLPGALPDGSLQHVCLKNVDKDKHRKCKGDKGSDLMWKIKTLSEWRKQMNLPPRLGDLRMWATRLHLYGDDEEEQKKISSANQLLAGLPVSTDEIPAEEQLMLLGMATSNDEAMQLVQGNKERPPPQLYTAPDPEEDPEAQKAMEHLATLAAQVFTVVSTGNIVNNATMAVLNHTREFFQHGVMPKAGLDELDDFILKKMGMLAHCGTDKQMKIVHGNISKELMCAMRVHLMNDTELNVFCPADAKVFQENCQNVEFLNYTAISVNNELSVIDTFEDTLRNLLAAYPTTAEYEREILEHTDEVMEDTTKGPVFIDAVRLSLREKELMLATLDFLSDHRKAVLAGNVTFQLDIKRKEREEADLRAAEHAKFVEEIQRKAREVLPLAVVPVDMGEGKPKQNLTLLEGQDVRETVLAFCRQWSVGSGYVDALINAVRSRVTSPPPLQLLLGVVLPTGHRRVLGIEEGTNSTIETGVFCARFNISNTEDCDRLQQRVENRLSSSRPVLTVMNIDAPDSRKLKLVVHQGEQHDIGQFVSDFLEYYKMYSDNALQQVGNAVLQRLPAPALQIPVNLHRQRQVSIRFSNSDNLTAVVDGFVNYYEIDESAKVNIMKMALYGMKPGSFLV